MLLCVQDMDGVHVGRIRNREAREAGLAAEGGNKNASRNIWEVVKAMVAGMPRPTYLRPMPRRRARRANPPGPG